MPENMPWIIFCFAYIGLIFSAWILDDEVDLVVLEGPLEVAPVTPCEDHVRRAAEYLDRDYNDDHDDDCDDHDDFDYNNYIQNNTSKTILIQNV